VSSGVSFKILDQVESDDNVIVELPSTEQGLVSEIDAIAALVREIEQINDPVHLVTYTAT